MINIFRLRIKEAAGDVGPFQLLGLLKEHTQLNTKRLLVSLSNRLLTAAELTYGDVTEETLQ
jgi:hypothetical protein